jgi:predicted enzyme related to lactoylglutathione lyase
MATITKHAQGTFCWPELHTPDPAAAKAFYAGLFGWTANDIPMVEPGSAPYTIFQLNGVDVAAFYPLDAKMQAGGMPPCWSAYVAVDSADDIAKQCEALGGKVLMAPFDVMGTIGRMAVLQDPTGAVISIWQAGTSIGAGVLDEPGALCWTELLTNDVPKAEAFYTKLIGYKTQAMPMSPNFTYTLFQKGDGVNAAGLMAITPEMKGAPPNWMSTFQTADIRASVAKAESLGGKTIVPVTPVPGIGEFAVLADNQGAVFELLQRAAS